MRRITRYAALLALAAALGGSACTAARQPAPARTAQTSYPSPDFPPQTETVPPAAGGPAPGLAERPLAPPPSPPPAVRPAPTPASPPPSASPVAPAVQAGRFEAMDADHNGRVSLEEWRNFQEREFRRLDANDDGVITREELNAAPRANAAPAPRSRP